MMNRYRSWNPGTPDFVTIETEKESRVISGQANPAVGGSTTVSFSEIKETLQIQVTSQDALLGVKLRWQYRLAKDVRFLGDAWERGYGDLRWSSAWKDRRRILLERPGNSAAACVRILCCLRFPSTAAITGITLMVTAAMYRFKKMRIICLP